MEQVIIDLVSKYPIGLGVLAGIGVLRVVFKPAMSLARLVVDATPGPGDNALLDSFERGPVYKSVAWFVDYIASIKLPGQK